MSEHEINLGPCCACEGLKDVRNVCCVHKLSPIPGRGWGCLQCHLPSNGAIYVLCDSCVEAQAQPKWACRGDPATQGRIPIEELTGSFEHDRDQHPELLEEHPLQGARSDCHRCGCCMATWSLCEECGGVGEIEVEMPTGFNPNGITRISCPSCEGDGDYWLCDRDCDDFGDHHPVKP